jgi:hypothetical protein
MEHSALQSQKIVAELSVKFCGRGPAMMRASGWEAWEVIWATAHTQLADNSTVNSNGLRFFNFDQQLSVIEMLHGFSRLFAAI